MFRLQARGPVVAPGGRVVYRVTHPSSIRSLSLSQSEVPGPQGCSYECVITGVACHLVSRRH